MKMILNINASHITIFISNNFVYISLSFISILLSVFLIKKLIKNYML